MSTVDERFPNPYPFTGIDFSSPASSRISLWLNDGPWDQVWYLDEVAGQRGVEIFPGLKDMALLERAFTAQAVRYCLDRGVRQFLVIGCGYPAEPMVHQIAEQAGCPSRCVYVDVDPVTVAHATLAVEDTGSLGLHSIFHADLRAAYYIWNQAVAAEPIRLRRHRRSLPELMKHKAVRTTAILDAELPIAIILPWVLPYVTQDDDLDQTLSRFKNLLPSGSMLIASHTTSDGVPDHVAHQLTQLQKYFGTVNVPITYRDRPTFTGLFDGLDLVEPAVAWASQWLPADDVQSQRWADEPAACCTLAAIGVKP